MTRVERERARVLRFPFVVLGTGGRSELAIVHISNPRGRGHAHREKGDILMG